MAADDFFSKPFDEGTLTKLRIFELYAREWLPVFLARIRPVRRRIHVFDFFAGEGTDSAGQPGSPLRLLRQLHAYHDQPGWKEVRTAVHMFDKSEDAIRRLRANISDAGLTEIDVALDVRPLDFSSAFLEVKPVLDDPEAAKLVLIDQFGVDHVTPSVFRALVTAPTCDFLFFLSSSTLHRFRDHPAIKQKILRPDDYYHVHRAALDYYRRLLPEGQRYFLAPFSIKKGSNIYGLIFGSAHPRGIDKFLEVAWQSDEISGEADFDIHRDNIVPGEMLLPFMEVRPRKLAAFEGELEKLLRAGSLADELAVMNVCFEYGMRRKHAERTLANLKREGVIDMSFRVPDISRWDRPREVRYLF